MQAEQFLDYLREHQATQTLAAQLADVLALRRSRVLAAATAQTSGSRRIAS